MTLPGKCALYEHHRFTSIARMLSADIRRYLTKSPANAALGDSLRKRVGAFLTPELLCVFLYRVAHCLYVRGWKRAAGAVTRLNFQLHRARITPQSCIGPGLRLPHPAGVTFHGAAGAWLTLYSLAVCCSWENSLDGPAESGPRLGDRVAVGAHAVLLGPISVGDDVKIAFSVRLDRDSPSNCMVICRSLRQTRRSLAPAAPAASVSR